jgi:DtxR family Mn-dependent transcriptional regulator
MTAATNKRLSASLEDYLETIYRLVEDRNAARAKDIGERLNVSRSSVTGALRALAARGLIHYAPYDAITLTDKGRVLAGEVARRHEVLREFFVKVLAVDAAEADAAACRIEHAIPESLLQRFVEFVEFIELCPRSGQTWLEGFGKYCGPGEEDEHCEACLRQALEDFQDRKGSS